MLILLLLVGLPAEPTPGECSAPLILNRGANHTRTLLPTTLKFFQLQKEITDSEFF